MILKTLQPVPYHIHALNLESDIPYLSL